MMLKILKLGKRMLSLIVKAPTNSFLTKSERNDEIWSLGKTNKIYDLGRKVTKFGSEAY
jgi:hypothetical protein